MRDDTGTRQQRFTFCDGGQVTKRQRHANLVSLALGLLTTVAVVAALLGGWLQRLELLTLDWRFRHANSIHEYPDPNDPLLVCIDIDDTTLARIGRWPWPRDRQAALVRIPAELGARAVLVDITWNEPEPLRSSVPLDCDVRSDPLELSADELELYYPDYELQSALRQAGNAYLAYDYHGHAVDDSPEFQQMVDARLAELPETAEALAPPGDRRRPQGQTDDPELNVETRARLVALLDKWPLLTPGDTGRLAGLGQRALERWYDQCRVTALRRHVRRWLGADPQRWHLPAWRIFDAVYRRIAGSEPRGRSPLTAALAVALRDVLGYEATTGHVGAASPELLNFAAEVRGLTPVYFRHARAARQCGFVAFVPDSDGVVRRMPLLRRHGSRLLVQLSLALACDLRGTRPEELRVGDGWIELPARPGGRPLRIAVDGEGRAVIPWVRGADWTRVFRHVPADALMALDRFRRDIEHNRRLMRQVLYALADQRLLDDAEARRTLADLQRLERQLRLARYRGADEEAGLLEPIRAELAGQLPAIEQRLRTRAAGPAGRVPEVERLLEVLDQARAAQPRLESESRRLAQRLRKLLAGKVCLIGYTATSLADMKPVPTSASAAGVMAHANLLNGLLAGRTVRWAPPWLNALLTALMGAVTAVLTIFLPPRLGLLLTTFLAASYAAIGGAVAFYQWTYWLAVVAPVLAAASAYVVISAYRYVFIEGERRQLATALGQYTSPEIARQMAEDPELCRRAEMREVTAIFTDLRGFTTLSERIGAQRTQEVLNVCLGRFTEVMLRHEAMINKFIGDGVFAFWNPLIYPQPDHARLAARTAVELLEELQRLRAERLAAGDTVFEEIVLRIGIATGKAVVGPCGSEQKYDYTCIGDSVNVAARLESANKFFGTRVLVSEATRDGAGAGFEYRRIGGVQVKGKRRAVQVFELLGRSGEVDEQELAYARRFGEAVELFTRRDWPAARTVFAECRKLRPDDPAIGRYLTAIEQLASRPPGPDWTGALELTEK